MVLRECRVRELGLRSFKKERLTYSVRAFITADAKVSCPLEQAIRQPSSVPIQLLAGALTIFNHYGGDKAVFFDLIPARSGLLSHVHVQVSATRPELALGHARAAVDRLLDRIVADSAHPHAMAIQRLELLSPDDGEIIAYQLTIPFASATQIGRFGGFQPAGLFAGHHAIFREAFNNPSPFYRLLLAYRAFEGVPTLRQRIAKASKHYKIAEQMPKMTRLDRGELTRMRLSAEVRALERVDQLFSHFGYLRDGIAHFLLKPEPSGEGHIYLSSVMVNTYAVAGALLLKYVRIEVRELEQFYRRVIRPHLDLGTMILPMEQHRERFLVVAPDGEDEFYEDEI